MIKNEVQLKLTHGQLARLKSALSSLKSEIYFTNPELFFVMAEGYIEHIMRLRKEIDDYTGLSLVQNLSSSEAAEVSHIAPTELRDVKA